MRKFAITNKKLRGVPRRLRALGRWASSFDGYFRPRSDQMETDFYWRIPVHTFLVQGRQTNPSQQSFCMQQLLRAAILLSNATNRSNGYYRVACFIVWPWLHQSKVEVFYDKEHYKSFVGEVNSLAPRKISEKLKLAVPPHFVEHGYDVTQPDDPTPVEWWYIGEPI